MGILKTILTIAALIAVGWLLKVLFLGNYPDFSVYYLSAKTLLLQGNPYYHVLDTHDTFLYEPLVLYLFVPFSLFPLSVAGQIFTLFSLCCLFFSLYFLLKIKKVAIVSWQSGLLIVAACVYFPTKFTLGMGQINMIILLVTVLTFYFYSLKKDKITGILLGLSIVIKFFPLLLLVYFFIQRKMKIFIYAISTILLCTILSWIIEPSLTNTYITHILPNLLNAHPTAYYNQALSGFIWRTFPNFVYKNITQLFLTVFAFLIALVFVIKHKKNKRGEESLVFSLLLTVSILFNSFSWQHHFVLLLPAYFFVFMYLQKVKRIPWLLYILLAISYLLTALNLADPASFPLFIQSHVFYGGFLLYLETLYILYRYDK